MKKFFRTIHLYLGLASGLVICIVCMTGAIMVFEKEWQEKLYPERYYVPARKAEGIGSIDKILNTIAREIPSGEFSSIKIYRDPSRTLEITYSDKKSKEGMGQKENRMEDVKSNLRETIKTDVKEKAGTVKKKREVKILFVDPYTSNIVAFYEVKNSFFKKVEMLHRRLLADETGKQIVGIAVVFFLFILLTGIVLWWPKNVKILKQRLKIKWTGSWKRKNHDWHVVIGFYASLFLFVSALTGLTFSYKWVSDGIYQITGSNNKKPEAPTIVPSAGTFPYHDIYLAISKKFPEVVYYSFKIPHEPDEALAVSILPSERWNENAKDIIYFDKRGVQVGQMSYDQLNVGHQIKSMMLPIHRGSILGLPGKILALLCALAGFTFPITGIILWLNRIRKDNVRKSSKVFLQANMSE